MKHDHRMLVALARTEQDEPLLEYASMLARHGLVRELRLMHVLSSAESAGSEAEVRQELEDQADEHFGSIDANVRWSCHVGTGERVDALLDAAGRWRTDCILLGHRRMRSGQRSLGRRLAMMGSCSVWMAPEGAAASIRRILAPVDFSDHSADALSVALEIARQARAEECLALNVFFNSSSVRYPEQRQRQVEDCEQSFERFVAPLDTGGVPFDVRCEEGPNPAKTILRVQRNQQSDLLVMNTRGKSRAAAILLGNVTTQVMIESPVAILVVKHFGAMLGLFQALKESQFWKRPNPKTN